VPDIPTLTVYLVLTLALLIASSVLGGMLWQQRIDRIPSILDDRAREAPPKRTSAVAHAQAAAFLAPADQAIEVATVPTAESVLHLATALDSRTATAARNARHLAIARARIAFLVGVLSRRRRPATATLVEARLEVGGRTVPALPPSAIQQLEER
jgi:hypothetical protein